MNILVNCVGFIGDILFASSLAKKLKEKYGSETYITYNIPLPQPKLLLEQNPYIDAVNMRTDQVQTSVDLVIDIPTVDQNYPATVYMQAMAGIENQSTEFDVWTVPEYDLEAEKFWSMHNEQYGDESRILVQRDWAWRAYQCTPHTLSNGIGAPHRNCDDIERKLIYNFPFVYVGYSRDFPSSSNQTQKPIEFAKVASLIKKAKWFIGAEGGLQNLSASLGTQTIITGDFIAQNYWKRGRLKQISIPQMGSHVYYPNDGHSILHPCISDKDIPDKIIHLIRNNTSEVFDWETNLFS